jgi:hypothetical protein
VPRPQCGCCPEETAIVSVRLEIPTSNQYVTRHPAKAAQSLPLASTGLNRGAVVVKCRGGLGARDPLGLQADLADGYVTGEGARRDYGIAD